MTLPDFVRETKGQYDHLIDYWLESDKVSSKSIMRLQPNLQPQDETNTVGIAIAESCKSLAICSILLRRALARPGR